MYEQTPREYNKDGTEKHIIKEGSRHHVIWWDSNGSHCNVEDCEINKCQMGDNNV